MFLQFFYIAILAFIAVVLSIQFYFIVFRGFSPYFSSKERVIKRIVDEVVLRDDGNVYELGCGNAGFLRAVEKKFPKIKKLIGTELFLMPYLISNIQLSLQKTKIKILKKDLFKTDIADADIIYCFLNKEAMKKLKIKLLQECKKGTQIISYQFTLPEMEPEKIIDLDNNEKDKIYFYKI
jgi:hypothetical protein